MARCTQSTAAEEVRGGLDRDAFVGSLSLIAESVKGSGMSSY